MHSVPATGSSKRHVALKVVKSAPSYTETARDEIALLQKLLTADPNHPGRRHTMELLDHFRHHGPNGTHICMVFELLGENLLGLIRRYQHRGVPAHIVRQIAKQVLLGLDYMHRKCGIIHTDLKPENVLICIDDVEKVVQAELDSSPSAVPTRIVGVPPSQGRGGQQTPRRQSIILTGSQPLTSPSSSLAASLSDKWNFGMSKIDSTSSSFSGADDALSHNLSQMSTEDLASPTSGPRLSLSQAGGHFQELDMSAALHQGPGHDGLSDSSPYDASGGSHSIPSAMSTESTSAQPPPLGFQPAPAAGDPNVLPPPPPYDPSSLNRMTVKIADFGNACWTDKHFTEDIQTRQYRAPEVILGAPWDSRVDMWSAACLFFELITGDYLFEPASGARFDKNDDHMAQMIELLGPLSNDLALSGKWSHEIFDRNGDLLHIHRLRFWPLIQVLQDKYLIPFQEGNELASFLLPMLRLDRCKRASARDCLSHPWLAGIAVQGEIDMLQRRERIAATQAYNSHVNMSGFGRESVAVLADALKPLDYMSTRASQAHIVPYYPSSLGATSITAEDVESRGTWEGQDQGCSPLSPFSLPPLPEATQEHSGITITGVSPGGSSSVSSSGSVRRPDPIPPNCPTVTVATPEYSTPAGTSSAALRLLPRSVSTHSTPGPLYPTNVRTSSPSPQNLSALSVHNAAPKKTLVS